MFAYSNASRQHAIAATGARLLLYGRFNQHALVRPVLFNAANNASPYIFGDKFVQISYAVPVVPPRTTRRFSG
jgi:hypothetical protein